MARIDEFLDDGRANEACGAGDENTHNNFSFTSFHNRDRIHSPGQQMGLRRESLSPWHFSFRSMERARRGKFNESQGAPRPLPDSFTVMRSGPTSITRPSPGSTILA